MNTFKSTYRRKKLFNRFLNYFLRGLLITIPLAATIGVIIWLFNTIDNFLGKDHFPGLGILILLVVITFLGFLGSSYITKPFIDWFDEWLEKTPGIKFLYSSVKDLIEAFVGDKKKFSEAVLVSLSQDGIYKIGFITNKDLTILGLEGYSAVYFPKSYGFMGDLYLVQNDKIKPLKNNSTAIFKMVVSGGVTGIEDASS